METQRSTEIEKDKDRGTERDNTESERYGEAGSRYNSSSRSIT